MPNNKISFDEFLGTKSAQSLDLGNSLIHFIAQDSVNKLDVEPLQVTGADFAEVMDRSEFILERQKLGYKVAAGGDWGLVSLVISGKPFWKAMRINTLSEIANVYTEVQLHTGNLITLNETQVSELIRFRLINGQVIKDQGYWSTAKWISTSEPVIYPGSWIPFRKFRDNATGHSEVANIRKTIKQLNTYSNQFLTEWNKAKLQFGNNKMFGSQKSALDWQKALNSGLDVHDFTDPDGTLQLPISALTGVTATVQHLLLQFNYLEDKALKYSFTQRESSGSGTNKHNLEIATFNQNSFEFLLAKKTLRELDYTKFFKAVADQQNQSTDITVVNPISELESMKLDLQRAGVAQAQAQATQMAAQAELYKAQAAVAGQPAETGE